MLKMSLIAIVTVSLPSTAGQAADLVTSQFSAELLTSRADFLANATSVTNRDFDDVTEPLYFNATAARYRDVTFSTSIPGLAPNDANVIRPNAPFASVYSPNGSTFIEFDIARSGTATIRFDNASSAIGFDIRGLGNARTTNLSFYDGDGALIALFPFFSPALDGDGYTGFIGFRSQRGVKSVTFSYNDRFVNDYFGVDNLVSVDAAVPEPASWAMIIAGFGLAGAAMRRRRLHTSFDPTV